MEDVRLGGFRSRSFILRTFPKGSGLFSFPHYTIYRLFVKGFLRKNQKKVKFFLFDVSCLVVRTYGFGAGAAES